MNTKVQSVKNLLLLLGMLLATFIMFSQDVLAQEEYKCTPCGCSEDNTIVHAPGNCRNCGMKLININNPSEALNYTNLFNHQACQLIKETENLIILDVRSEGEFAQRTSQIGRLKKAINIPITDIEERLSELDTHKSKPILVYCSVSARSPRVSQLLADSGFTKIYNLMGGLNAWNTTSIKDLPCKTDYLETK